MCKINAKIFFISVLGCEKSYKFNDFLFFLLYFNDIYG